MKRRRRSGSREGQQKAPHHTVSTATAQNPPLSPLSAAQNPSTAADDGAKMLPHFISSAAPASAVNATGVLMLIRHQRRTARRKIAGMSESAYLGDL